MGRGAIALHKFVITKQLTKRPSDYPDAQNQPHVQIALRRAKENKRDGVNQVSSFAKCKELHKVLPDSATSSWSWLFSLQAMYAQKIF